MTGSGTTYEVLSELPHAVGAFKIEGSEKTYNKAKTIAVQMIDQGHSKVKIKRVRKQIVEILEREA